MEKLTGTEQELLKLQREEYNFYLNITQDDPVLTYTRYFVRKRKYQDDVKKKYPEKFNS